jgi:acetoin utilization protein AcuB
MISKQLIAPSVPSVKVTETGSDALYYMDEYRVSFLPVLDGPLFLGIISESEVFKLTDPDAPLAEQKVPYRMVYVSDTQHIFEVIKIMSAEKISILPVLDENKLFMGCITFNNLIEQFGNLTAMYNPGAIIILELNQNDYVLSQIAQIVESQDIKILSLYVSSDFDSTKMEVTIKLNKYEIQSLIKALNRYDYTIKATFLEDEKMVEDLLDRYNALMNYLNI